MTNKDLVQRWITSPVDCSDKHGNLFYKNGVIYSSGYHFPVARHVNVEGRWIILYTTDTYSVATTRHTNLVKSAIATSGYTSIGVTQVRAYTTLDHMYNYKMLRSRIRDLEVRRDTARSPSCMEKYQEEVQSARKDAEEYCRLFLPEEADTAAAVVRKRAVRVRDRG